MAQTQVETKRMTLEEVKQLNPDEQPGELVRGVFVPMSRPTVQHGRLIVRIARLLDTFAEARGLGGGSSRVDLQACKLGTGRRFTTS
jgi:hypothetical protein